MPPHAYPTLRRATLLAAVLTSILSSCAGVGTRNTGGSPDVLSREEAQLAVEALQRAERLFSEGDYPAAIRTADSLWMASRSEAALETVANRALWLKGRALEAEGDLATAGAVMDELLLRVTEGPVRHQAVARRASIMLGTGSPADAIRLLLDNPTAIGDPELELMRGAVVGVDRLELRRLASEYMVTARGATIVHAELSRDLILADDIVAARRSAREVLAADPADYERRLAEVVLEAEGGLADRPLKIGAVLPLSGRFAGVGGLLREGIELAVERRQREVDGPGFEVVFEDDRSDPDRAVALVKRLEEEGALAIIGPIRAESFSAATRARRNPRLLMISPTATEVLAPAPNSFTLWDRARRERDVARDLGAWIVESLGLRRMAVLYGNDAAGRGVFEAFVEGLEAAGGELVQAAAYSPDSTTFAAPIATLAEARPDVVFVSGSATRSILQIAPQLFYYGLDRSLIAGGPTWSEPAVVRRLDAPAADHRVIGTFVDRMSEGTPWDAFKTLYENRYRKSLSTNMLPALGYDAADLILTAMAEIRLPLPGAVSRSVPSLPELQGATGTLRLDPESSSVSRTTLVRVLLDRSLGEPEPAALLGWLDGARMRADSIAQARVDSIAKARADTLTRIREHPGPLP